MISTLRHQSIFNAHTANKTPITIIGAGATGSRVFMSLLELGLTNLTVVDFDHVEAHNLANQAYLMDHVGGDKVAGLQALAKAKLGIDKLPESMRFINTELPDKNVPLDGIIFLLTDTMHSRKAIFDACIRDNADIYHVFETRMASSYGNVFSFNPNNPMEANAWLNSLTSDDDAEVSACGSSISVGPTAAIIANMAVWQYILLMDDPEAMDEQINIFLKPALLATETMI